MNTTREYEVAFDMWSKDIRNVNEIAPLARFILQEEFVRLSAVQEILDTCWEEWECDDYYEIV